MTALHVGIRGQAVALALTFAAIGAVWLGVVAPAWNWYDDRAELLRRQRAVAHRMATLVETLPALREAASRTERGLADSEGTTPANLAALLSGDTDALAAASLQQRIDGFATTSGLRIASEEILPTQVEKDLRAISVRVTVSGPYRSFVGWLMALARSEIPMVADELQLRGPPSNQAANSQVDANLTVTSWWSGPADKK